LVSEDCLPPDGHIESVGASLPEFEVLGYPENKMAYYIRCPKCVDIFANPQDPNEKAWAREWLEEINTAKKLLEAREMEDEEMDVDEQVSKLTLPEAIDLTKSESQSTATTDAEEYNDRSAFEKSIFVGRREIIVID
jgi:hypothetical protein